MISFPDIRYNYQQTVESVVIQKSTQVITALAFHIFHIVSNAALVSGAISSFVIGIPIAIVNISLLGIANGIKFASKSIFPFENLDSIPKSTLQQLVLAIDSIAEYIVPQIVHSLKMVALAPFKVVTKGIDFIEDIAIKITQIVLDTLGIPIKLHISRKKLLSILKEWQDLTSAEENKKEAVYKILKFYDRSKELIPNLFYSYSNLRLDQFNLRSLPQIFQYIPFSKLDALSLKNNQLSHLPTDIFNLSNDCDLHINQNKFSEEEILKITDQPNYRGPVLIGISDQKPCVLG